MIEKMSYFLVTCTGFLDVVDSCQHPNCTVIQYDQFLSDLKLARLHLESHNLEDK